MTIMHACNSEDKTASLKEPDSRASSRWVFWTATIALSLIFLILYMRLSGFTAMDAFISFRYARNWAIGNGIVFNPGERVEGYTNFLWVAVTALLHHIPGVLETREYLLPAVKILAFLFPAGIFIVCFLCLNTIRDRILCTLFLISAPGFILWSVSGMETVPFACLILLLFFLATRDVITGRIAVSIGVISALTVMMRPEGLLFACLGLAYLGCAAVKKRLSWRHAGTAAGVFVFFFGTYMLWRMAYFGNLLPNTFHAKVGASGSQIVRGADYFRRWSRAVWYVPLIPVFVNLWGIKRCEPRHLVSIASIVYCLYVVAVGGDWMSDFRFFVPILPLVGWSFSQFAVSLKSRTVRHVSSAVFLAAILLCAADQLKNIRKYSVFSLEKERNESAYILAEWFNRQPCKDSLIAMGNLGRFNYYSDYPVIDTIGLVDPHIARIQKSEIGKGLTGHEKQDPDYVLSRKPVFFFQIDTLLTAANRPEDALQFMLGEPTIQYLLRESAVFKKNYEKRRIVFKKRNFTVFVRKDARHCIRTNVRDR